MKSRWEMISEAHAAWETARASCDVDALVASGNALDALLADLTDLEARTQTPALI